MSRLSPRATQPSCHDLPWREAGHSQESSAKIKKAWSYTSNIPYVWLAWCCQAQKKLSFYFYLWLGDMILLPASQNAALLSEAQNSQQCLYCFVGHKERRNCPSRFSAPVQTGPAAHPGSYTKGTGYFPGLKRPERGVDHPPPSSAKVKESRAIPLPPSGTSWPVLGWTLPLFTLLCLKELHLPQDPKPRYQFWSSAT